MKPLTIINTAIRQDIEGRYCLNDLHRAAVARGKATASNRPGTFLKRPETIALVAAIQKRCTGECIAPVVTIKGGAASEQGTYVTKPLVYAYAMWIDADFNLDVIEASEMPCGFRFWPFTQLHCSTCAAPLWPVAMQPHQTGQVLFSSAPETTVLIAAIQKRCTGECITPVFTSKGNSLTDWLKADAQTQGRDTRH
ncbi:KilA-N domain-containing protein [Polaromonas sp.]|uniref:KilA-N domain-containing protein n=1 Tax=Polaromonas sp. TaxID=1869339 RepID=UPI0025E789FB|nr:KilA-N domain-containing protein [Polaromonas sp.]